MPPELKRVINSIDEMVCENCVCSHNKNRDVVECCNPSTSEWQRDDDEFCSKGQWLWLGVWSSVTDDRPQIHLFHFEELYEMFARSTNATRT